MTETMSKDEVLRKIEIATQWMRVTLIHGAAHELEHVRAAVAALYDRLAQVEKDAARYRWLRERPRTHSDWTISVWSPNPTYGVTQWLFEGSADDLHTVALDTAVDAARAEPTGTEGGGR